MKIPPYKDRIIYQIYPLSFKDSNNDGIGDINGIISEWPNCLDFAKFKVKLTKKKGRV